MNTFHRFLYGTIVGSMIVWTIYLLTIDFYSIAFIPYQYKHLIHVPFLGNWLNLYVLAIINIATILAIFCSAFIAQLKNIKVISSPIYNIDSPEEEIKA